MQIHYINDHSRDSHHDDTRKHGHGRIHILELFITFFSFPSMKDIDISGEFQ